MKDNQKYYIKHTEKNKTMIRKTKKRKPKSIQTPMKISRMRFRRCYEKNNK